VDRVYCGHQTLGTMVYAFEVVGGQPRILWQNQEFASRWARHVIKEGRLYGIDVWGHLHTIDRDKRAVVEWPRPMRPEGVGQFQCRDLRTGKLLWSSDELWQGDTKKTEVFICEDPKHRGSLSPCPCLTAQERQHPAEGCYTYTGEPGFVLVGDTLVFKAARPSLSGLFFAQLTGDGLKKLSGRSFYPGKFCFGDPVVSGGRVYYRLNYEQSSLPGIGNLICFKTIF